ncbi:MAG TPA: leucine--tRNA ligase [Candidatus Nanoarchaeia archaeon]|nr:leucine--tRNA ligase [Candidatus Nanoarchaeia archaeon]
MALDWEKIQEKWAGRWLKEKVFEANPDNRKKFFVNAPYPYVNSVLHIGHLYTYMRTEAFARYKRMQGFNVLFPQGWHATGTPITSAAKRVKEKEPKQLKLLKDIGITDNEINRFEQPEYWIEYFRPKAIEDFQALGLSVDWRREFITTSLNPHYDKFIRWQFNQLKESKYVIKGQFPVVWDPVENCVIGDHDRSEGEGETPQEFLLIKHRLEDGRYVVSATLRPDTILGITNLYVHPKITYVEISINKQVWILSETAAKRLEQQGHDLKIKRKVPGTDLIGLETEEFGGRKVLILPATFLNPEFGTGLVHSVPSDSADDLIALQDLQKDEKMLQQYHLSLEQVRSIQPIAVLKTAGYSDLPAQDFLHKYNVKSQHEKEKLELIKKELYKLSHYSAKFNHLYKNKFSKNLEDVPVEKGKDLIQKELIKQGWAWPYYELTGKVVSRYLNECIVKIVDDQWFLAYGDENWKRQVRQALQQLTLYPEKSRVQFEYVIGWLNNWACTRESGLGTRLPWDEKWLIESLSDSTIYMAYYTIAHLVKNIDLKKVDDELFDYVFLGKKTKPKIELSLAKKMRDEFNYWYPVDFRNSGKDLIQNHLAFFLFNHTAIFPRKHWPRGIGVNGWVSVDGEKMSKSKGNIVVLREMPARFGADCARFTILNGGEELDDPNWDSSLATALRSKLEQFHDSCIQNYGKGRKNVLQIDRWLESKINEIIVKTTAAMEKTLFRSSLQTSYFEFNNALKWYLRRTKNNFNQRLMNKFIVTQLLILAPITPFICEEIWEKIGQNGLISQAAWPKADKRLINEQLDLGEAVIKTTLEDIEAVIKLAKIDQISKITLIVSPQWKFQLVEAVTKMIRKKISPKEILTALLRDSAFKPRGQEIVKILPRLLQTRIASLVNQEKELQYLQESKDFFKNEFNCRIEIVAADLSAHPKAKIALPGKVGVVVS